MSESEAGSGLTLFTSANSFASAASSFRIWLSVRICSAIVVPARIIGPTEAMRSVCRDSSSAAKLAGTRS